MKCRSLRLTPCVALAAVASLGPAASSAHAAFPGRNGAISFNHGYSDQGGALILRPGSRSPRLLWDGENPYDLQFSPGGRLLAFKYGGSPFGLGWFDPQYEPDIWLWSARSGPWSEKDYHRRFSIETPAGDRKMIPSPREKDTLHFSANGSVIAQDIDPDWSPSGKSIIFSRRTAAESTVRIFHRGHSRAVTAGEDPTWSVRNEIAFVRWDRRAHHRPEPWIYVARPDGSQVRKVARGSEPDWSPDGRRLAFATVSGHIATVSNSGSRLRRVTKRPGRKDQKPSFSPGGRQLAFIGDFAPMVVRIDGRRLRRLWSPVEPTPPVEPSLDWQTLRRR